MSGPIFRTDPVLGVERFCRGCDTYWPDDAEFYYKGQSRCRACVNETARDRWWKDIEANRARQRERYARRAA